MGTQQCIAQIGWEEKEEEEEEVEGSKSAPARARRLSFSLQRRITLSEIAPPASRRQCRAGLGLNSG